MEPVYLCEKGVLYQGDCREVLKELPDASIDSVVTDPPAGIEFMGKQWDDPKSYKKGFTKDGIGKGFLLPTKSSRNPTCINCGGEKRRRLAQPERQCTCDNPDFNEVSLRGVERDRFIDFMQEALAECLRVLKPGGHALVWSLPRTSHWTATALENAGFEVRDCIYNIKDRSVEVQAFLDSLTPEQMELLLRAEPSEEFILHIFGSGFPKNLNISKALDKVAGRIGESVLAIKREIRSRYEAMGMTLKQFNSACGFEASGYLRESSTWATVLPNAKKWAVIKNVIQCEDNLDALFAKAEREVIGQAAWTNSVNHFVPGKNHTERIQLDVSTPTTEEAKKWSGWGTALKPAAECWWLVRKPLEGTVADNVLKHGVGGINIDGCRVPTDENLNEGAYAKDGSERYDGAENWRYKRLGGAGEFNQPTGRWPANLVLTHNSECKSNGCTPGCPIKEFPPFYYSAKASKSEKNIGLSEADLINKHPTVKSQDLMQYLVRLTTPKSGTVLDPFAGSGSTLLAALSEGMNFVGIEQDPEYITIAKQRLATDGKTKLEEANQRDVFETMMNGEFDKD
jgi:DNA modification methylase